MTSPTADEARVFGSWTHDDNFGVDRRDQVIPARLGAYAPYLSPPDLMEMRTQDAFWPLGLAAEYDQGLASSAQAMVTGHLPGDAFEQRRAPSRLELAVDWGHGWGNSQWRPLRINHNGLSYATFDLRADGITAVRLDPCDQPSICRIDWIELGLRVRGSDELVRLRLEGGADFSRLGYTGCRWLYDGVVISTGADPQIAIPLAHRAAGVIYGVELAVALAVMALPPTGSDVPLGRPPATRAAWAVERVRTEAARGGPVAVGTMALRYARRRLG